MCAVAVLTLAAAGLGGQDDAGLRLTGRALVAVPQANHTVFLTWRLLRQDGPDCSFDVLRSPAGEGPFAKVGAAKATTIFLDSPGAGTFFYRVVPAGGDLKGTPSHTARAATDLVGRDWVEVLPAARGRKLQFSDRHFADTDGDGELEFLSYHPQVPSYRGGTSPESYKLQVLKLLEDTPPRWTFDTGMGTQSDPSSGDKRADWDYEWTFKPVAGDLDGDGRAEIVTLAKRDGKYQYVLLRDEGAGCRVLGAMDSPIPVADLQNNSRHFPLFARLGGKGDSLILQGGTYGAWRMWAYDWTGTELRLRWQVDSKAAGFQGNRSSSHTILPVDLDGDGRDEINNGATVLDDDGSVLWTANADFGPAAHVDGQVIDDIDPRNPGLELMTHAEQGDLYALYDARTGKLLWKKKAPGRHLQLNIAANVTGSAGLDILGVWAGHKPAGGFACRFDGNDLPFPYAELPRNGDRWWPMDWDGARGRNVCLNFTRVYGLGGRLIYEVDLSDAPAGDVIPWNEHDLFHYWANVDIVGDYREDILVQMPDGSIRAYINTRTPPARRPCKWQSRAYRMLHAPGDYRYFIRALDERKPPAELAIPLVYTGRNQTAPPGQGIKLAATLHDGRRLSAAIAKDCRVIWSKLLGPGDVTFADASALDTTATLATAGTYILRLTVSNAAGQAHDDVAVFVRERAASQPASPTPPAR